VKNSSILSFLLVVTLILPSFVLGQTGSTGTGSSSKLIPPADRASSAIKPKQPVSMDVLESDLSEALTVIQDNHVNGKKLDYNELFKSSIEGMLHTLDPHSNYFDAKEFEQFTTEQRSEYFGIGATIGDLNEGGTTWTYIRATFDGAPAHRAGLRYGDKIVEVNGVSMKNKPYFEVRNNLRGPRGTTAKLVVERYGSKETRTVEIVRDAVPQPSVPEIYMISPGVGYVAMTGGFNRTTAEEFRAAMANLKAQGLQRLILDLRGNGGGLVGQAYQVASAFLPRGQVIFTQKGRVQGTSGTYPSNNPNPDNTPLVVLVNRSSASASEIVAGALQDHDRALIVGEPTFGKGLVQNPFPLPYNSALLLTIAKYQTPSGRTIQRDYSTGNLYDYYTQGGTRREEQKSPQPTGNETRTDTGRIVYGGGGITPDEIVKPQTLNQVQQRLNAPAFSFALDLMAGKIAGFESFKFDKAIDFEHDFKATDFPVSNELFAAFKKFAASKPEYKVFTAAQLDKERAHIVRQIRYELATAAYGSNTAFRVYNEADPQILRAIELFPKAQQLAQSAAQLRTTKNPLK
jgi:carboxyl-terminal processing protease